MNPINPETLAVKLQSADFMAEVKAHPRRPELLWFIQWRSLQPDGLKGMASEVVKLYGARIGTALMLKLPGTASGRWSAAECKEVWREMLSSRGKLDSTYEFRSWGERHFEIIHDDDLDSDRQLLFDAGLERFNHEYFAKVFADTVKQHLPDHLEALCVSNNYSFARQYQEHVYSPPEFACVTAAFPELCNCLFDYMDWHSVETMKSLGQNQITEMVFKRLDFSQSSKYPALILGDARVGKTKSVSTWCKMRPGLARLVTVPDTNREWEFYAAHADAFGLPYTSKTQSRILKRSIEAIVQHSGLFIVYDEFHFALPARYSRNTAPARLNWMRCQVIDRGVGCAFFATRQTYHVTVEKFVEATRFQMEQWLGRVAQPLILPAEIDHEGMMAAAQALFPGFDEDLLGIIVERCVQKESGFRHLEAVAKYALWIAGKAARTEINLEDVDTALDEMLKGAPDAAGIPAAKARKRPAPPPLRTAAAEAPQPRRDTAFADTLPDRSMEEIPAIVRGGIEQLTGA